MGYGIIPENNGKWACLEPCEHSICKAFRKDFIEDMSCKICDKPLKAGDKFYYCNPDDFPNCTKTDKVHMLCEIERIEKERKVK